MLRQSNSVTWWRRTTATLLDASFGSYRRHRRDLLMGRCGYDVLVTYHWDVAGCFIWDLFETLWRRTDGTSSLRPLETFNMSARRCEDVPLRCFGNVQLRRFSVFHLRRTCGVAGTSRKTLLRRLHDVFLPVGTINDPYAWVCVPNKVKKHECTSI